MVEEEPIRQGGTEADSRPIEDIGVVAVAFAFAFQRSAEQQRDAAWARLEVLAGELGEARAGIASLNAELRAAEEIKVKLEAKVDMWRAKDAEYQRFREQCHWLGVFAGRKERFRKVGGRIEGWLSVPFAIRPARVWIDPILSARAGFPPGPRVEGQGCDGAWVAWPRARRPPASVHHVASTLMQIACDYVEGPARFVDHDLHADD
jgi:hypothetical protein